MKKHLVATNSPKCLHQFFLEASSEFLTSLKPFFAGDTTLDNEQLDGFWSFISFSPPPLCIPWVYIYFQCVILLKKAFYPSIIKLARKPGLHVVFEPKLWDFLAPTRWQCWNPGTIELDWSNLWELLEAEVSKFGSFELRVLKATWNYSRWLASSDIYAKSMLSVRITPKEYLNSPQIKSMQRGRKKHTHLQSLLSL